MGHSVPKGSCLRGCVIANNEYAVISILLGKMRAVVWCSSINLIRGKILDKLYNLKIYNIYNIYYYNIIIA